MTEYYCHCKLSHHLSLILSGIITQAYLLGLLTCTFDLKKAKTTRSYGRRCTTREGAGIRSPFSWVASLSPSRLLFPKSASACLMAFLLSMTSPSVIVRCRLQWRSVPLTHISTACTPKCVWSICSSVTLWMTVEMDRMKKDAVSFFGFGLQMIRPSCNI